MKEECFMGIHVYKCEEHIDQFNSMCWDSVKIIVWGWVWMVCSFGCLALKPYYTHCNIIFQSFNKIEIKRCYR